MARVEVLCRKSRRQDNRGALRAVLRQRGESRTGLDGVAALWNRRCRTGVVRS